MSVAFRSVASAARTSTRVFAKKKRPLLLASEITRLAMSRRFSRGRRRRGILGGVLTLVARGDATRLGAARTTRAKTSAVANAGSPRPDWYAAPVARAVTSELCDDGNPPLPTMRPALNLSLIHI